MSAPLRQRVAVVGGGISGLAAAWELTRADPAVDVTLVESATQTGGKLLSARVAGHTLDVGSESVLARRPEFADLASEAGLGSRVVHPTGVPASIWTRGRHWPLPPGTLMGVPGDPSGAAGILDAAEVDRARDETVGPPLETDVSVGEFVESRVGPGVVDRLVEPLLSGVYAGHARRLSLRAAVPAMWTAAVEGRSVTETARTVATLGNPGGGPVFAGYRGGLGQFVADLTEILTQRGVDVRVGATVRDLGRLADRWRLTTGPTTDPQYFDVDAVVVAVPAAPAARLLRAHLTVAADLLAGIDYASVAIVTLALPRSTTALLHGSGFLAPPVDGAAVKAATFSSNKWAWLDDVAPETVFLRTSLGRAGEVAVLQRDDTDLAAMALADLRTIIGPGVPAPLDVHVQRWGGGIPQYAVGHVDRVAAVSAAVASETTLGLAGAAYEGVGIPACIATGRAAARSVLAELTRIAA